MLQKNFMKIKQIFSPPKVGEGVGSKVRRIIGARGITDDLDPFLMLDHFRGRLPGGFPDHPHRDFVAICLKGLPITKIFWEIKEF